MQWIVPVGCILFLFLLSCGCVQSPAATVTPGPADAAVNHPADTTSTPQPLRDVNVTAMKTESEVVVIVNGGKDAAALASMDIRITNYDGTVITRAISPVAIGKPYVFAYRVNANAARINIVGTFSDGNKQTILMTPV
jgi:hypothetical protein